MRRRGTLAGQLTLRVAIIVAALALLLSSGTILAASSIFMRQFDSQLDAAQARQQRAVVGGHGSMAPGIDAVGMAEGTVVVAVWPDGSVRGSTITDGGVRALSVDAAKALLAVPNDGNKHTVNVPNMGLYRVEASTGGIFVVVALPLDQLTGNLRGLALFALGLGVLSIIAATIATQAVAGRVTRPLRNLGRTAAEVSRLPLEGGDIGVTMRVEPTRLPPTHEVSQLTDAFNHMLEHVDGALAARQASEAKLRRFVADASHELRNPLAAISGYSELAGKATSSSSPDTGGDVAFALDRIGSESTRMTKLVNDLLLLARLDADAPVAPRPVDLTEVVLNAASDARATDSDHAWRLSLSPEPVFVMAEPDQVHQVVVNLLSNARTHTPSGTTVTAAVAVVDGRAHLSVTDDGPGITPQVLPHVFERFTRADEARAHTAARSTGLGLAIVQAVVERFGGTTAVTSRPGETRFTVTLPLVPTHQPIG